MRRRVLIAAGIVAAAAIGTALFAIGRATAPSPAHHAPSTSVGDYFDGLRVGEAEGRREGRVLQEGISLPKHDRRPVRHAFDAGYTAGANDAFAGYDGGWALHVPWIVTIEGGAGQIAYRIKGREQIEPGVEYFLCADGHSLCHQPRR
ncbi:MAG TPA: hypothetical protein VGH30_13580 [Jatrophihabitantaceae bacterium]|jgi:hypothetical protein